MLFIGVALLSVGLLFKIGAAPFHSWIPDVYVGAPTPITAFMASATKVAAFGALLRVFYVAFAGLGWEWRPVAWGVAILTMVVGSVFAITQTDVKRMLAYSSIAHAGFILIGVIALNKAGLSGSMFYLVTYGITTIGAFAVLTLVRDADGEATHLSRWAGLGRRSPLVGGVFTLFLLALAGIPLTSGFTGKFAVFSAGVQGGATPLVIVAVITSAMAAFFYVRVIVMMFFADPVEDGPVIVTPGSATTSAIAVAVAVRPWSSGSSRSHCSTWPARRCRSTTEAACAQTIDHGTGRARLSSMMPSGSRSIRCSKARCFAKVSPPSSLPTAPTR